MNKTTENFTYDVAHSALCIHEYVFAEGDEENSYWNLVYTRYGTDHVRHIVLTLITPKLQMAFEMVMDDYDDPFDFDFVPNVLDALDDPINDGQEDYNQAAKAELIRSQKSWAGEPNSEA